MVGGIEAPKDVHVLIPGSCDSLTLYGKRHLVETKDLAMRRRSWIIQVDPGHSKGRVHGGGKQKSRGALKMEKGATGQAVWVALRSMKRQRNGF